MVNTKHAFWIALVLTLFVFSIGIFLGLFLENARLSNVDRLFYRSEISLMDSLAYSTLTTSDLVECDALISGNLALADRVYNEAKLLEEYSGSANFVERDFLVAHQRYDLLRTLLWIQSLHIKERCDNNPVHVIYFYNYTMDDINQRAEQVVWSKILTDLKENQGSNILLIPIAVDTDVATLKPLLQTYNITNFPVVLVDERVKFNRPQEVEALELEILRNSTSKTTP